MNLFERDLLTDAGIMARPLYEVYRRNIGKAGNVNVFILPAWIYRIATRNKITVTELMKDPETFDRYVSKNDKLSLIAMNTKEFLSLLFKAGSDETIYRIVDSANMVMIDLYNRRLEGFDQDYALSMSDEYFNNLLSRMTDDPMNADEHSSIKENPAIVSIDRNTVAVLVDEGQLNNHRNSTVSKFDRIRAVESILRELYTYLDQTAVQTTPWFSLYIDLLAE